MKVKVIGCDRCGDFCKEDSREAQSFSQVSVLKSGVCKEYDLCPTDADLLMSWFLGDEEETPSDIDDPVLPQRDWDPHYGYGPKPGEVGDVLS